MTLDEVVGTPPTPLIPVFVTGTRPTRVCAAKDSFQPKDLGWLDPCDKHRDEGVEAQGFAYRCAEHFVPTERIIPQNSIPFPPPMR